MFPSSGSDPIERVVRELVCEAKGDRWVDQGRGRDRFGGAVVHHDGRRKAGPLVFRPGPPRLRGADDPLHAGVKSGTIWPDVAMKRVKIAERKDHLSRHLREVEQGAEIEVTDRDRPIAQIVPVADAPVAILPPKRPFSSIRRKRYRPARWGASSTDLLLEERQRR
jgi:antitoxin (DNA-binding transcriptional repressor) of toxin-antitoxin stability system